MSEPARAVFLSYASQDAEAARRIADALRAAGVEVWFDQNELVGGDAWDQKIRRQIKECALFIPVISTNTQARAEGYFRLEWRLADQRTHLMGKSKTFLLPVCIDGTHDAEADVPDSFIAAQWMRLPAGDASPAFCERVQVLLGGALKMEPRPAPVRRNDSVASMSAVAEKSVAVLAFANLSRDADNEYFSDGISEELLNVLAKVPGLRVAARTSAFYFKGKNLPVPEIARQLGVTHVVEGSVRKAGERVRITAQLIAACDGFHLWSDTFDRELKDIFAVQDEIARLIAQNLQLKLGHAASPIRPVNPEAHRCVLEARHFWLQRTDEGFARADAAYAKALQIDPDFAEAHAGLADVASIRAWYRALAGTAHGTNDFARAREEAQLALRLNPALAEPHATLGAVNYNEGRFDEAEQEFQTTLGLNPNYAFCHHWRAHLLMSRGLIDESLAELECATSLDPLSFVTLVIQAAHLEYAGRDAESLAVCERARALRNDVFIPLQAVRALVLWKLGHRAPAVEAARVVTRDLALQPRWWVDGFALHVLREAGCVDEAKEVGERVLAAMPESNGTRATILAGLGRTEEALAQLARVRPEESALGATFYTAMWAVARERPQFVEAMAKAGALGFYRTARATLARMEGGVK